MATFSDKIALVITATSAQAVGEVRKLGEEAKTSLGKGTAAGDAFTKSLKATGLGALGAIGGLSAAVVATKALVEAGRDQERAARVTEAVLASTGFAAHVTAKNVDDLAKSLSRKIGIDDTAIRANENLLLTFTNVRNEVGQGNAVFNRATADIQDMAVALGQDARFSTIQLGKALQDPIRGLTALRRVGVQFTDSEKEKIRVLVQSGRLLEAQKIILGEIEKEFGGAAEAAADPLQRLGATINQLKETGGEAILPSLNVLVGDLQGFATTTDKATRSTGFIGTALGAFTDGALKAAPGIGLLVTANEDLNGSNDKTTKSTEALKAATDAIAESTRKYAGDLAAGASKQVLAEDAKAVADAQERGLRIQQRLTGALQDGADAVEEATTSAQKLSAAQKQLNLDLSNPGTGNIKNDVKDLTQATLDAAAVEYRYAQATSAAQLASDLATGSVISLADAYLILGQSAAQASSQSLDNLNSAANTQLTTFLGVGSAADKYNESLDNLTTSSGSAGGSAKNLTAAYYDQVTKLNAVRDAQQQVADSQVDLQRAHRDEQQALNDAAIAAQNYQDALNGVDAASQKGRSARDDVLIKRDAQSSARLDFNQAVLDRTKAVKEHGRGSVEAQRADLAVRDARRRLIQTTTDYTEAQQNLNGTLHGFAAGSPQLVQAQNDLRDAQDKAADSAKATREATDAAADAQVNMARTTDDLQGKLDSLSSGGATKQVENVRKKLDEVKLAAVGFADSIGQEIIATGGTLGQALTAEIGTLKSIVDQQPALKGAFDSVLNALTTELQRFLTAQSGRQVSQGAGRAAFADGGWVPGPPGAPLDAVVHGGEFVLSRQMLANGARSAANVTVQVSIVNPTGNGGEIARQLVGALNSGQGKFELKRALGVS